jgi:hypothetical protein
MDSVDFCEHDEKTSPFDRKKKFGMALRNEIFLFWKAAGTRFLWTFQMRLE